jgi:hypothetical protein
MILSNKAVYLLHKAVSLDVEVDSEAVSSYLFQPSSVKK